MRLIPTMILASRVIWALSSTHSSLNTAENKLVCDIPGKTSAFKHTLKPSAPYSCDDPSDTLLDREYYGYYTADRSQLHCELVDGAFTSAHIEVAEPWIVFTAGSMGVGKGHVINPKNGFFNMESFVIADPDTFKLKLPEFTCPAQNFPDHNAGSYLHRESTYIADMVRFRALKEKKNLLVDGTLQHQGSQVKVFKKVHEKFVDVKFGIIHVVASEETRKIRAEDRARKTGRASMAQAAEWSDAASSTVEHLGKTYDFIRFILKINNDNDTCIESLQYRASSEDALAQHDAIPDDLKFVVKALKFCTKAAKPTQDAKKANSAAASGTELSRANFAIIIVSVILVVGGGLSFLFFKRTAV